MLKIEDFSINFIIQLLNNNLVYLKIKLKIIFHNKRSKNNFKNLCININ